MNGKQFVVYSYNAILFSYKKTELLTHETTWMDLNLMPVKDARHKKNLLCNVIHTILGQAGSARTYFYVKNK